MITQSDLKKWFEYNLDTGEFTRKFICARGGVGSIAGRKNSRDGRIQIKILGKMHYAHRLAWLYMTGEWPKNQIDHINRNGSDNKWSNLRDVTKEQNLQNQGKGHVGSISKKLGVYFHKKNKKWCAQITVANEQKYLGIFRTEDEAYEAYVKAKEKLHPYWSAHV